MLGDPVTEMENYPEFKYGLGFRGFKVREPVNTGPC